MTPGTSPDTGTLTAYQVAAIAAVRAR
jgi:hypothetical protein